MPATTEFTAHQTEIPGLIVFDVTSIEDDRGFFQEKFQQEKLVAAGFPANFKAVQTNISYNAQKGVARGVHAEPWDKYISVVKGRIFVAYVDLRAGETFGKTVTLEVDKNKAVFVPKGVGNSFQTLEDDTYYIYTVTAHWSQELYSQYLAVNMADPELGIEWPIPLVDQAIVSDRDKSVPLLKDITPISE